LVHAVWLEVLGFCWWGRGRVQFTGGLHTILTSLMTLWIVSNIHDVAFFLRD